MASKVRVRFAPSPTGPLHIGGVRTALYNYLFARKHGGDCILRIEDTDSQRFVPGAEEYIIEAFRWCGIVFSEGPHVGGPHAPYRQSERKGIYRQYAEQLVREGKAYYAFDRPEELEQMRKELEQAKAPNTSYCAAVRKKMKNSLTLPAAEVKQRIEAGEPYVIRILIPENEEITVSDGIRKTISVNTSTLDDKVLWKSSDGLPTYHLANVVDDHLMEITHVIRGEEWLPSLPLHVLLYRYLGWEDSMPFFAHLPLILKPDGKGKLSKRDGDKFGFPVYPLEWKDPATGETAMGYREAGYLPEAFLNMLALLGWNPGGERELFSLDELAELFSIEHVGKSGARFDPEKAKWFNHQYLIRKSNEELARMLMSLLEQKGISYTGGMDYLIRVCELMKERINFIKDIAEQGLYFFRAPEKYDAQAIAKRWSPDTPSFLNEICGLLNSLPAFNSPAIHEALHRYAEERKIQAGLIMVPLRIALTGSATGPDLGELMALLGKEEVVKRIRRATEQIKS